MTTSQNEATCTNPIAELLVPLSQGQLGAEDSGRVLDHVERCAACSKELDFLADVVTAAAPSRARGAAPVQTLPQSERGHRIAGAPAGRIHRFPFGLLGALAAAAAVLFFVVPLFLAPDAPVAPYAQWTRPTYQPVRGHDAFEAAMLLYLQGLDAEADAALTELIESAPEPDVLAYFYRAAARVELERTAEARDDLLVALGLASGGLRDHTLWNLANVHLLLEDADAALPLLDELSAGTGDLKNVATELAAAVRAR